MYFQNKNWQMAVKKDFIQFDQVVESGAGMNVHKEIIVVTITGRGIKTQTKSFKTFTGSLKKIARVVKEARDNPLGQRECRRVLETCV